MSSIPRTELTIFDDHRNSLQLIWSDDDAALYINLSGVVVALETDTVLKLIDMLTFWHSGSWANVPIAQDTAR